MHPEQNKILDVGCIRCDEASFHNNHLLEMVAFTKDSHFLCGHNIFSHDLVYLRRHLRMPSFGLDKSIDTLLLSPLLFPKQPYHRLLKDDKLQIEELNNPLNDAKKARDLFYDEVNVFKELAAPFQQILCGLLLSVPEYACFFRYMDCAEAMDTGALEQTIRHFFEGKICADAPLGPFVMQQPVALAYALALLNCDDRHSITPPWVLKNYPAVDNILFTLRNTPCVSGCAYCKKALDPNLALKTYFGFDQFRSYDGVALQEQAVRATVQHQSILAVFPTGGGKSITFQVPALMSGNNAKALTVVISPLQSLMKDQVDNLEKKNITEAVTINGLLDPIERSQSIERVENGSASLLYISPESLRSVSIERLLLKRTIARFVIDEAHCFSSWGQDFRVDYLYIGDFIKGLQQKKNMDTAIPVSCFTATAKPRVIEDIRAYFKEKLQLDLQPFSAKVSRPNLHYQVYHKENDDEKYNQLRNIIAEKNCPVIVYVSRTRRAYELAKQLTTDGFNTRPYHGKMDKVEKTANQNDFMTGVVNVMVATSAFGMGVDKNNVGAVIHYDISDSLENYVQEAGRAGRDEQINAECYVLFNEGDLDNHFILLNQTRISSKEINQVWRAIKELTRFRLTMRNSALEIARKAGWDEGVREIETRVKTAIAALEDAGYLRRGQNMPRIFANSILSKSAQDAINRINQSTLFTDKQKVQAIRIIKKLFSSKSKRLATEEEAESRVDYIAEHLGIVKGEVIRIIDLLRTENILAQTKDLTAFIKAGDNGNRSLAILEGYRKLEAFLLGVLKEEESSYHLKEINEQMIAAGLKDASSHKLKTILNFWTIKHYIKRSTPQHSRHHVNIGMYTGKAELDERIQKRHVLARLITEFLYQQPQQQVGDKKAEEVRVEFSVQELKELYEKQQGLFVQQAVTLDDVEDTLFYLSRIGALQIEGGFMVVQNELSLERLETNTAKQYTLADYEKLNQFYLQRVQQIHIVGEYAKKMIRNYQDALQFVDDYFVLNYASFIRKYFPGSRGDEIKRTLTPEKFEKLFSSLSPDQLAIINDQSPRIVVAAGPGSGKTRVLVHKLASLLLAEDVKHEQLLMLTFSRAAATEFKTRLMELIGNAAHYIEIKTFHSFCFDLLFKVGNLGEVDAVLRTAIDKIQTNEIEKSFITKTCVVVDEAQDMNADEYALLQTMMAQNEDMRIILVGDDDQNIYGFRKADSKYMLGLITELGAKKYELVANYRSKNNIVQFCNQWATRISKRLKETPGISVSAANGQLGITTYNSAHLAVPVVDAIENASLAGSTCVMTRRNSDAVQLVGLLRHRGIKAKLIQSNEGFNLADVYEVRCFTNLVSSGQHSPQISAEQWEEAVKQHKLMMQGSSKMEVVQHMIQQFETINPVVKYKSSWQSFITESKWDDFVPIDQETVFVSTMHGAKGKEFDNVYVMLPGFVPSSDEDTRLLYVAFTRTETNLQIHYNGTYLRSLVAENLVHSSNNIVYPEPPQLSLLLSHKSVRLGYFEFVQHRMKGLQSGDNLTILEDGLGNGKGEPVLKYSQKFNEELAGYRARGYQPGTAKINFKVYWRNLDTDVELLIILPELCLVKGEMVGRVGHH